MPRRRKTNLFENLVDLVALMPWYAGVVLAIVSYILLRQTAAAPPLVALKPGDGSSAMVGAVWRGVASAGQYILPLIYISGAAVSVWRRGKRRSLLDSATRSDAAGALDGMSWREFEMLVGEGFRLQGYTVVENRKPGPDEGIDLILRKGGEQYLVQCKQWRAFKVGVPVVRELYGVMAAKGAAGGFVVTSGRFTAEAEEFASGRNVRLIDGPKLQELLRLAKGGGVAGASEDDVAGRRVDPQPSVAKLAAPTCPRCAQAMVRRTAKKGPNAGQEFWGCSGYPRCRGTA